MNPNQVTFSRAAAYRLRVRPIEGALVRARAPFYKPYAAENVDITKVRGQK